VADSDVLGKKKNLKSFGQYLDLAKGKNQQYKLGIAFLVTGRY